MRLKIRGELLPGQRQFLSSWDMFLGMFGGYGSGKTHGLCLKGLQLADANPGVPGGLVCPTTKMFKRDVLPLWDELCSKNGVLYRYHRSDGVITLPWTNSKIYVFHGEDDGVSIKGPNLGWMLLNEMTLLTWNTFKAAIGRVRLKNAPRPQIAGSGTPEDFNWAYDKFIDKPMRGSRAINANTRDNKFAADFYVGMLEDSYDDIAQQQFIEGLWVPSTGRRAIHKFDRRKHTTKEAVRRPGEGAVWAHVDFNVHPMAATCYQYLPDDPIPLRAFAEVNLAGADTYDLARALKEKIGFGWQETVVFPDPAGVARKTSAKGGITDIKILRDEGFSEQRYKTQINVRDCLNAANNLFAKGKVLIHESCTETIRDFERVKTKEGSHDLDKSDPLRTHWVDGFKNMADYEFPVTKSYTEVFGRRLR